MQMLLMFASRHSAARQPTITSWECAVSGGGGGEDEIVLLIGRNEFVDRKIEQAHIV